LDEKRGFLFAACDEGSLRVINPDTGKIIGTASSGDGVDIIAYNPKLGRIYLPGGDSATMAIVGISAAGSATVLRTVKTAKGAHCATTNDHGYLRPHRPASLLRDVTASLLSPDAIYDEIVVKQGGMPGAADVAQAAWVQKVSVANRAS
jgi:hypothetical protein